MSSAAPPRATNTLQGSLIQISSTVGSSRKGCSGPNPATASSTLLARRPVGKRRQPAVEGALVVVGDASWTSCRTSRVLGRVEHRCVGSARGPHRQRFRPRPWHSPRPVPMPSTPAARRRTNRATSRQSKGKATRRGTARRMICGQPRVAGPVGARRSASEVRSGCLWTAPAADLRCGPHFPPRGGPTGQRRGRTRPSRVRRLRHGDAAHRCVARSARAATCMSSSSACPTGPPSPTSSPPSRSRSGSPRMTCRRCTPTGARCRRPHPWVRHRCSREQSSASTHPGTISPAAAPGLLEAARRRRPRLRLGVPPVTRHTPGRPGRGGHRPG